MPNPSTSVSPRKDWSFEDTEIFINIVGDLYGELTTQVKAKVFEKIAERFNDALEITTMSPQLCSNKWKSLIRTYKNVKQSNGLSGNGRKTWQYYELMDKFLCTSPDICSVAPCSSDSAVVPRSTSFDREESSSGCSPPPAKRSRRPMPAPKLKSVNYRQQKLDLMTQLVNEKREMRLLLAEYVDLEKKKQSNHMWLTDYIYLFFCVPIYWLAFLINECHIAKHILTKQICFYYYIYTLPICYYFPFQTELIH